ncbi:hypothetical protein ABF638_21600 [Nostoc sp. CALU 1950]
MSDRRLRSVSQTSLSFAQRLRQEKRKHRYFLINQGAIAKRFLKDNA